MPETQSKEALLQENQQLHARLQELEETVRAIRSGEVDAVVMSGPDGEQVYTLRGALEPYRVMVETMSESALTLAHNGTILYCNGRFAELVKTPQEQIVGLPLNNWVAAQDREKSDVMLARGRTGIVHEDLWLQADDRTQMFAHFSLCPLPESAGKGISVVIADLSERKQAEEALREQEEFFRLITENVDDYIAVLDLKGRRLYNSPSYARLFGDTRAMKGTDSFTEIHPDDREHVRQAFMETVRSGHSHQLNFRFVLADGSIHYMESCSGLVRNSHGQALRVVVVSRDITERIKEEENIRSLAFYDTLTQLPNRRLLDDRLDQAMVASKRSGKYGALLFLDLDNFKPLNDVHGHRAGDLLLAEVAHRIAGCMREVDTVARFGGDEFVVLISELKTDKAESAEQACMVAEKIRATLAEPYVLKIKQGQNTETVFEQYCTSSVGVTLFMNHEASAQDLLRRADMAMYQAKEEGGNQIRLYEPQEVSDPGRLPRKTDKGGRI